MSCFMRYLHLDYHYSYYKKYYNTNIILRAILCKILIGDLTFLHLQDELVLHVSKQIQ